MTPPTHLRFIIGCLTALAVIAMAAGAYLLVKGYQSGELFVTIAGSIAGGIVGMISMRGGGVSGVVPGAGDVSASLSVSSTPIPPQPPPPKTP